MKSFVLTLLLCWSVSTLAVVEIYLFEDELLRQRYQQFITELRCPKCQNQNLSGSNSEIAVDLRRELYRMLNEGKSDKEIVDFMVARYGEFILYRPPLNEQTAILWFAPVGLMGGGLVVLLLMQYRQRRQAQQANLESTLSEAEQAELDALLTEEKRDD